MPRPPVWLGWNSEYNFKNDNVTTGWPFHCDPRKPLEVLGGEMVINKARAWRGLWMAAFINRHHAFFLKRIFKYGNWMILLGMAC